MTLDKIFLGKKKKEGKQQQKYSNRNEKLQIFFILMMQNLLFVLSFIIKYYFYYFKCILLYMYTHIYIYISLRCMFPFLRFLGYFFNVFTRRITNKVTKKRKKYLYKNKHTRVCLCFRYTT